jgi:hypothetical protein
LIPSALETSVPPSPTSEIAGTQEAPLVQIGHFDSIYLRYDPEVWAAFNEYQGPQQRLNYKGEPVEALRHRTIPGCFLHHNLGRGSPPSWELQATERMIDSLEYWVEVWSDTQTQTPALIVYQYPVGQPGTGKRIELVIDQEPEGCIKSAEDVLILSGDLMAASQ